MRIAIWHNLGSGGAKRVLFNHIKALLEKGHYLEAWTTDYSSSEYLPLSELIIEHRKGIKKEFEKLAKIKNSLRKELKTIKLINKHCIECAKEIEEKKFDLVFANSCCITFMPYIGKFTKLPKIVYLGEPFRFLHEAMPYNIWQAPFKEFEFKKIKTYIKELVINYSRRIKLRNEIEASKEYNRILVNSLFSRENVIRAYGLDASVCYLGIDTDYFKPVLLNKEPYVVGLGTIGRIKSVHKAIEIIGTIPKNVRPVLKWIASDIDKTYHEEMVVLATKLDVDVQYFINILDSELISIVSRAAIMIYAPILEPFGLAPLEANACGTYVVAIAEGGVRESITNGKNGTLINGYKINEIAFVITHFIQHLEYAKKMGDIARDFVESNWNNQIMADNILTEVESIKKSML